MGDFNDQPADESLQNVINTEYKGYQLINLSDTWASSGIGTIKFRSQWQVYDQIIVSRNLLIAETGASCGRDNAHVFREDFILVEDHTYGGVKPFRTYSGYKYLGGFSDHLPVYLDLFFR